jgi:uncharacterized protein
MVARRLSERSPLIAFPVESLFTPQRDFCGFTMRRVVDSWKIFELCVPKSRRQSFPDADYRFLVRAAINMARAVAAAHATSTIVGDLNNEGFLISRQAIVSLIDADSFQIPDGKGGHYLCRVKRIEYTPPELIGLSLSRTVRTPNHDAFGLAVLIFQLLFMGRHPFAGTPKRGDIPIAEAIRLSRFVYSLKRNVGLSPPIGMPSLHDFPSDIAKAFEEAFSSNDNSPRPSADQWVTLLTSLERGLRSCGISKFHAYPAGASACIWCSAERALGLPLFGDAQPAMHRRGGMLISAGAWPSPPQPAALAPVPPPPPPPSPPSPMPIGTLIGWGIAILFVIGMLSELVSCASSIISPPPSSVRTTSPPVPVSPSVDYSQPEEAAEPPPRYSIRPFPAPISYLIDSPDSGVWIQLGPGRDYASGPLLRHGDEVTGNGSIIGEDGVNWISITGPDGTSGFIMERLLRPAAVGGSQSAGPSFACSGTLSWDERAICEDADLAAKDRQMVSAYRDLLASLSGPNRQNLMNDQAKWLRERRDCPDSLCLSVSYYSRIRALQSWSSNVPIDEPADARRPSGPRPNSLPQQPVRDVDQVGDERARVRAERARARADRAKNRAQGAGNREGYVAPAEGPICILPSGQEARVGEQRCRELSGVIYQ